MGGHIFKSLEIELATLKSENEKLRLEHEEFKTIFMISKNGIALLDLESNFLSVNPAYLKMSGYTEEELLKTSCIKLSVAEDVSRSIAVIKEVIRVGYVENYEKTCILKGRHVTVNMSLALLPDKKTILINTVDITKNRALQVELYRKKEQLKRQAYYDILTDIPNRYSFNYTLNEAIKSAKEKKENFALMFIDLNKFKNINDTYGHAIGDKVLKKVATEIQLLMETGDYVARIGGDEFTVICKNLEERAYAYNLAEKIIQSIENIKTMQDSTIDISASIGISMYPDNATTCKSLLISSDLAMYEAKKSDDTNIIFYTESMKH